MYSTFAKRIFLSIAVVVLVMSSAYAQDIHFSQFYASPLTLNPALTGRMNGDYRVAAIYRNQWNSITSPFVTPSASFDMPFFIGKNKTDVIGAGIVFVNDKSNDGAFTRNTIMLSVAYHKSLGAKNKHQLSLGLQGGYVQLQADPSSVTFASQYNNAVFDDGLPGETLANDNVSYPDFNLGLFYNGQLHKKLTFYTGFSLMHLFTPEESFVQNGSFELPSRYVVHSGFDISASKLISIIPGFIFMNQAKAHEVNFGTNVGFHVVRTQGKETTLYLGGWYRLKDAVIPTVGIEFTRIRLGVSYDVNTSDLNDATNTRGGFEISAIYVGKFTSVTDDKVYLFCPRY